MTSAAGRPSQRISPAVRSVGAVQNAVVDDRRFADGTEIIAALQVESAGSVDEEIAAGFSATGQHRRAAAALRVVGEAKVQQSAGVAIVARRHRTASGHQQLIADHGQRALRRDAGEGIGLVRLLDVHRTVAVVDPSNRAALRV